MINKHAYEIANPPYRPPCRIQYQKVTLVSPYDERSPSVPFCQRIRCVHNAPSPA